MSGEPKTLTATQEDALLALVEAELDAQNAGGLERGALGESLLGFARRAVEAVGARVVARDEAAELRAVIAAYVAALDEFRKQETILRALPEGMGIGQPGVTAAYNLDGAELTLRRLAGGENEK